MDMRIPPFTIKMLLESNPLKSRILVQRLAVPPQASETPIHMHRSNLTSRARVRNDPGSDDKNPHHVRLSGVQVANLCQDTTALAEDWLSALSPRV